MQLSYEDRLHVWLLACWHGMAYWNGHGLLISAPQAVRELNALTDGPQIREDRLRKIVAEFKDTSPPYASADPASIKHNEGRPASAYGYELVNGVPRWNNGGLRVARKPDGRTETGDATCGHDHRKTYKREWMRRKRAASKCPQGANLGVSWV
jgi:hypothetical protein